MFIPMSCPFHSVYPPKRSRSTMSPNAVAIFALQHPLLPPPWAVPAGDSSFCRQIEHRSSCDSRIRAASRSASPHAMASSQDRDDWTERSKCSIYMFFVVVYAFSMHEHYRVHDARARQAHARDGRANHGDVVPLRPRHASAISASPRWSVVPRVGLAAPFVSHLPSRGAPPRRNAAKAPQTSLLILPAKLLSQSCSRQFCARWQRRPVPAATFPRGIHASQRSVPRSQSPRAAIHHKNLFPWRRPGPIRMQRFTSPLNVAVAEPRC